ncbi:MAG: glycosyltransferase family 4 protein [Muribaculaceae bacterium]|nr:glycosyltransferase family 4 protein [Muribaculaceae bacterium]
MKKLLIDANPSVPYLVTGHVNGIGRTNFELIRTLDGMRSKIPFEIELYTQNIRGVKATGLGTGFKARHVYLRNNNRGNRIAAALRLRELTSRYDLMHITHNFEYVAHPEKCIVTIHDAMMFSYPEPFLGHDFAREFFPPFARKAKAIVTCSENSKREISEYMDVDPEKIFVAPWGVNHKLLYPHKTNPCVYTGGKPFFVSVSCDRGRKNTINIVKAFIRFNINNPVHHLILVWRNPSDEVLQLIENNSRLKQQIHFASNISNEELAELYTGATCSLFPSRYEGFGLPIAESMACGTPVVTCRNSSLEEVGGNAAFYVDPDDIDAMVSIMDKFENGELKKEELSEICHQQSMLFTWKNCAEITLDVYKKCLEI